MSDNLRDRIAAALAVIECEDRCGASNGHPGCRDCVARMLPQADAVIRELYGILVDWGLWLAEEITGRQMTRLDMESCLTDWKADDE